MASGVAASVAGASSVAASVAVASGAAASVAVASGAAASALADSASGMAASGAAGCGAVISSSFVVMGFLSSLPAKAGLCVWSKKWLPEHWRQEAEAQCLIIYSGNACCLAIYLEIDTFDLFYCG